MTIVYPKRQGRSRLRQASRVGCAVLGLLTLFLTGAHLVYTASGRRQWTLLSNDDHVQVFSQKIAGETLEKFRAVFTVRAKLSSIVAFMQDTTPNPDIGFFGAREVLRHSSQDLVTEWQSIMPAPFRNRDFVVRHMFIQDPANKEVVYTLQALPDLVPRKSCCVRVPRMDNDWELIPEKGGVVLIRWTIDMDVGGSIPYFMANAIYPSMMASVGANFQSFVSRPKYANAGFNWISEPAP